ncbi:MAG: tetratricopeptide repeat protein [bacterium]
MDNLNNPQPKEVFKLGIIKVLSLLLCFISFEISMAWAGGGPNVNGAKLYIQQNDLDSALNVLLKEIREGDPNNEDAWYLLGYVYARQRKYDEMVVAFKKAVQLKPKFKKKGIKISRDTGIQFYSKSGTEIILRVVWGNAFNVGVKYFNEAINVPDDSSRTKFFYQAIEGFRAATLIMPDSTLAYRNWAAALMNVGKYQKSIEPLKKAIEHNPDDSDVKTMLAQVYMINGQNNLALPVLEKLWEEGIHTEEVADYLSRVYIRTDKIEKAKEVFRTAIEVNPDNFNFRYNYGTILVEAKAYDEAIEQLKKAYEIDPESPDLNYNLGAAYLNRGVVKREALPIDSEDISYKEDIKLAFPYLVKSIKLNPDNEQIWLTLGRIAGQLNKISLAGYAFSKAENNKSAFNKKVMVGMQSSLLKSILGEPDEINPIESEQFLGVEEWIYKKRKSSPGKFAISGAINIYINSGRVETLMALNGNAEALKILEAPPGYTRP